MYEYSARRRSRRGFASDRIGLFFAIILALGSVSVAGYQFAQFWEGTKPQEIHMQAYLPENGGWIGNDLQVDSGRPVRLSIDGVQGAHAFAIAHTDVRSPSILPGQTTTIEFTAPEPGRYVLYCTVWCSPDHWRMRTVLDVVDPDEPDAPLHYVQDPQRYSLPLESLELDAPHPAEAWPEAPPSAAQGAALWPAVAPDATPGKILDALNWPLATPAQIFEQMASGELPEMAAASKLTAEEQWSLIAFLWQSGTTPDDLALGSNLYTQNCAACHGTTGQGDGFSSSASPGTEPNFRDASMMAGASPALYYAKIARGGMGTGMPNWGTILTEDELWAVTDYLYSFMFDYGDLYGNGKAETSP